MTAPTVSRRCGLGDVEHDPHTIRLDTTPGRTRTAYCPGWTDPTPVGLGTYTDRTELDRDVTTWLTAFRALMVDTTGVDLVEVDRAVQRALINGRGGS